MPKNFDSILRNLNSGRLIVIQNLFEQGYLSKFVPHQMTKKTGAIKRPPDKYVQPKRVQ